MFLHPWAIAIGLLAAGLPVAVHFLTRPRPVRFPISTLKFVREAIEQRRARHRLRDVLVLLFRTLAVLLLAAAIARPLIGRTQPLADDAAADVVRVVLLDVSQSMGAGARGIASFERARPIAAQQLEFRSGTKANLILAGAHPRGVFDAPSSNFGALQEALAAAAVRPERLRVQEALNLAAEQLGRVPDQNARRELIVVSDFQRTNWASADFSVLPEQTDVRLESVATGDASSNLAVLRASALGRVEVGREAQLAVEVGNFSSTPRTVQVEVDLGDTVYPLEGNCPARSRTVLHTSFQMPVEGWRSGIARLVGVEDALAADNQRHCVLQARPQPIVALLTQERAEQRPSASYYVERALSPAREREARAALRLERISAADPDPVSLARAEAFVIVRPSRLSNEAVHTLVSLLRRGRGVLYVAADGVDAVNLQQLADAAAPGLQLPVEYLPPPPGSPRVNLFPASVRADRPPFAVFGDQASAATSSLRFTGGLATRRAERGLADDVLASLNDQSALLVVTSCDAGRLAVLNADLAASNLPHSSAFVPLLAELMQHDLLRSDAGIREFACGEPLTVLLTTGDTAATGLEITGPGDSDEDRGRLSPEAGGVVWHADAAGPPGVYEVRRGPETLAAAVTGVPDEESDLRALPEDVFKERLAGGRKLTYRAGGLGSPDDADTLWTWLAVACVLCLLGEAVTLRMFRT